MAQVAAAGAVDGFVLLERIHAGGFGVVHRVRRPDLDLPLVMKIPRLGPEDPPSALASHEAERAVLGALRGPHVPRLVASGDVTVRPYLVLEEIAGTSLAAWTGRAPVEAAEVARLGAAVAAALEDVHAQRVIHLDVKPENVIVRPDGSAALVDFGLARHADLPDLVAEEVIRPMGSPGYVSPEQLLGVRDEPRSDVFALGVVLYELATGRLPFGAPGTDAGLRRRLWRDPVPPRALVASVPEWLQEVVLWCLEPEPAERPSPAQVAAALSAPAAIAVGPRGRRTERDGAWKVMLRSIRAGRFETSRRTLPPPVLGGRRTVLVAVATAHPNAERHRQLREAVLRLVRADADCRLTCVSIIDPALERPDPAAPQGIPALRHLALLRVWAAPLGLPERRLAFHVLESTSPADTLLEFVRANPVHHVVVGAPPADEALKRLFGTVSSRIADEAPCDVTVVRYAC